jgi:hypothetical protein
LIVVGGLLTLDIRRAIPNYDIRVVAPGKNTDTFTITNSQETLTMQVSSVDERDAWIVALVQAVNIETARWKQKQLDLEIQTFLAACGAGSFADISTMLDSNPALVCFPINV